jgi:3D (Asp-Asp-Asp) domain-containing protein
VTTRLIVTGYCPCGECCGWTRNWLLRPVVKAGPNKGKPKRVGITASGVRAQPGTIAADTRLYPFGTIMHVPGYGYGMVEDRGSAIKGRHIDLYFRSHRAAEQWGKQKLAVRVWKE